MQVKLVLEEPLLCILLRQCIYRGFDDFTSTVCVCILVRYTHLTVHLLIPQYI